jgi:DNA-binding MarR family transcriptional regulator
VAPYGAGVPAAPVPADLPRLVVRAGRAVARAHRGAAPGLSPTARALLALVDAHGPRAHRDLAVALGVAPATVTAVVDGLERAGHVARTRDAHDRRVVRVGITAAGRARLATDEPPAHPLPHPPPAEAEVVRRYLDSVLAALGDGGGADRSVSDSRRPE